MVTERRTQEGSALRKFIDNQLDYLGNLFSQWEADRLAKKRQAQQENAQIERIVEGSDKRIRAVNGYLEQLHLVQPNYSVTCPGWSSLYLSQ